MEKIRNPIGRKTDMIFFNKKSVNTLNLKKNLNLLIKSVKSKSKCNPEIKESSERIVRKMSHKA